MEGPCILAFIGGEGALPFEDVFLEAALVYVWAVLKHSVFFRAIFILSLEEIVIALFLSFPVEDVVLEMSPEDYFSSHINTFPVAPAKFDVALIIVSVGVDESSKGIGQACSEDAFVVST